MRPRQILAVAALAAAPALADAAAWTRAPGEIFVSAGAGYYRTGGDFPYEEMKATTYVEVGVLDRLTLGGELERKEPLGENTALGTETTLAAFGRFRLREGRAGDPLSLQLRLERPVETQEGESRSRRREDATAEARLLYGRGFATALGDAFAGGEVGLRSRFDESAGQLRLDLTAGLRPTPRWLVMLQSFNTVSLRNEGYAGELPGEDYDVFKLAASLGREVGWGTLVLGVEREVAGRGLDALGTRWSLSLWREF